MPCTHVPSLFTTIAHVYSKLMYSQLIWFLLLNLGRRYVLQALLALALLRGWNSRLTGLLGTVASGVFQCLCVCVPVCLCVVVLHHYLACTALLRLRATPLRPPLLHSSFTRVHHEHVSTAYSPVSHVIATSATGPCFSALALPVRLTFRLYSS